MTDGMQRTQTLAFILTVALPLYSLWLYCDETGKVKMLLL